MLRRALVIAAQSAVSVVLLAWMFRDADFRQNAFAVLMQARPGWAIAALLSAGVGALLGIVRWGLFLRMTGIRISGWQTLRIGAVGLFFNSFLPGAVGGDAVKAGWLAARGHGLAPATLSAVMDRLSGLGALILFSAVFMGARWAWLTRSPAVSALAHVLWGYLLGVVLLLSLSFAAASRGALDHLPENIPGRKTLVEWGATYGLFLACWPVTLLAASLSVVMLALYFLTFYFSARALDLQVPVLDFFALMPIVDLVAAIPVSLGGFGVREGAFVTLLGQLLEIPAAQAVSLSLLGALASLAWGCAGLALLPTFRRDSRLAGHAQP